MPLVHRRDRVLAWCVSGPGFGTMGQPGKLQQIKITKNDHLLVPINTIIKYL